MVVQWSVSWNQNSVTRAYFFFFNSVKQERKIILYCDFHGHSRQQNVFIYGCEDRKNIANGFKERVFPMMLSKNCQDKVCGAFYCTSPQFTSLHFN